jgi:hypothetical protein
VKPSGAPAHTQSLRVIPHDGSVLEARLFAERAVASCDAESRVATAMVVMELTENIVKYGVRDDNRVSGTISITVSAETDGSVIRIQTRNPVDSDSEARDAQRVIKQTAEPEQLAEVYRARFTELLAKPDLARTQLGLLRAAAEGGFRLSCSYEPPVLVIVAERRCQRSAPI